MDSIISIFRQRAVVFDKLASHGFIKDKDNNVYKTILHDSGIDAIRKTIERQPIQRLSLS